MDEAFKRKRTDLENMVSTPPSIVWNGDAEKIVLQNHEKKYEEKASTPVITSVMSYQRRKSASFCSDLHRLENCDFLSSRLFFRGETQLGDI